MQHREERVEPHLESESRAPEDTARLAEAWSHEFLHVAMMSSFVALGCNGLALRGSPAGMAAIEGNIPDEPAVHRAVRQGLLELPPGLGPLKETVQRAYDGLAGAIAEFRSVQSASAATLTVKHLDHLAEHWRGVAELMLVALEHFAARRLLRPDDSSGGSLRDRCPTRIRQLLSEAMDSRIPTHGSKSALPSRTLPERVQRRRWNRKDLDLPCRVEAKGRSYATSVRNVSLGGALLDGLPFLMRGTQVRVTLDIGRSFDAAIMWARDGNAGVKFTQQLLPDDPLIRPEPDGDGEI